MATHVVRVPPKVTAVINVPINTSASGATAVVAAVAGLSYRVLGLSVVAAAANSIKFQSNASDLTGLYALGANGGIVLPFNEHGWFQTNVGEALNINLSAATAVGATVQYQPMLSISNPGA